MSKSGISSSRALTATLVAVVLFSATAAAQLLLGAGDGRKPAAGGSNNTAIDGTPVHKNVATVSSTTITASTTASTGRFFVAILTNAFRVDSITSANVTFTQRASVQTNIDFTPCNAASDCISLWSGTYSSQLSSEVMTITYAGVTTFSTIDGFGVTGQNGFDANAALPWQTSAGPAQITTSNANDMILCAYRFNGTASPTQGTGMTIISGADFMLTEYKKVTATQAGFSCPIGTGDTDELGSLGDAVKSN